MNTGIVGACVLALALAGCGDRAQVVVYKQGQYQGKPDGKPWDNDAFSGDRTEWEATIRARNQNQNEYRRING
ncbi:MAG TPA: hypothetical protein VIO81_14490 [Methyloversatilis sp.]